MDSAPYSEGMRAASAIAENLRRGLEGTGFGP
jgi:hypothetical protein